MKKAGRSIPVLLMVLFLPNVATGRSVEDLLHLCELDSSEFSYCAGYIAGFYDGRTTDDYGIAHLRSCPPTDETGMKLAVTYSQMVRVFLKWAHDNPSEIHNGDWSGVRAAFAGAWPCRK